MGLTRFELVTYTVHRLSCKGVVITARPQAQNKASVLIDCIKMFCYQTTTSNLEFPQ